MSCRSVAGGWTGADEPGLQEFDVGVVGNHLRCSSMSIFSIRRRLSWSFWVVCNGDRGLHSLPRLARLGIGSAGRLCSSAIHCLSTGRHPAAQRDRKMVHAQVAEVGLGRPPTTIRNGLRVPAALGLAQAAPSPVAACTTPSKFQGSVHAVSHSLTTLNVPAFLP